MPLNKETKPNQTKPKITKGKKNKTKKNVISLQSRLEQIGKHNSYKKQ